MAARDAAAALALGLDGPRRDYVPDSDDVLFHTRLVQPGESEAIYFTAPAETGEYTYVCTFPGHAASMRGTMRVPCGKSCGLRRRRLRGLLSSAYGQRSRRL